MTDTPERSYDGCPREGLGYLHLWRAGVAYAELAETQPDWRTPAIMEDAETGLQWTEYLDADTMSLFHFFCFWGYVNG